MITPYQFQQNVIQEARQHIANGAKSVCLQSPTGSGKTIIAGFITEQAFQRRNLVWIVVPRNEILDQFSSSLTAFNVPHFLGKAGQQESRAFRVHVWSLDTLIRRINAGKIKRWPDIIIFDEAHLNLDRQLHVRQQAPDSTVFLGPTATPQRLDGRGLSEMYDAIVYGPELQWLVDNDYLSPVRYFAPPIQGLDTLHRRGTDYDSAELEQLFERKAIYGKAIDHYDNIASGKPCLVFCRSIKASMETADRFTRQGFRFASIDGKMSHKKRAGLIEAVKTGQVHGLTSCDLVTYGLDVPGLQCIIKLRPTLSKALDSQMNGRVMRYQPGKKAIILDHVGALQSHGHPLDPYQWRFDGTTKHKPEKGESAATLRLCDNCYLYYEGDVCPNCGNARKVRKRKENEEIIDGRLVEVKREVIPLRDRDPEEQRETQERINQAVQDHAVKDLLAIAEQIYPKSTRAQIHWVYSKLNTMESGIANRGLLHEIAKAKGYKRGWVFMNIDNFERHS